MPGWFSMKLHVELNVNTMDALSLLLKCRIMTPSLTGLSLKLTGICRRLQERRPFTVNTCRLFTCKEGVYRSEQTPYSQNSC
jgi:hypothetical protein